MPFRTRLIRWVCRKCTKVWSQGIGTAKLPDAQQVSICETCSDEMIEKVRQEINRRPERKTQPFRRHRPVLAFVILLFAVRHAAGQCQDGKCLAPAIKVCNCRLPDVPAGDDLSQLDISVICDINSGRADRHMPFLDVSPQLQEAARRQALHMATHRDVAIRIGSRDGGLGPGPRIYAFQQISGVDPPAGWAKALFEASTRSATHVGFGFYNAGVGGKTYWCLMWATIPEKTAIPTPEAK